MGADFSSEHKPAEVTFNAGGLGVESGGEGHAGGAGADWQMSFGLVSVWAVRLFSMNEGLEAANIDSA